MSAGFPPTPSIAIILEAPGCLLFVLTDIRRSSDDFRLAVLSSVRSFAQVSDKVERRMWMGFKRPRRTGLTSGDPIRQPRRQWDASCQVEDHERQRERGGRHRFAIELAQNGPPWRGEGVESDISRIFLSTSGTSTNTCHLTRYSSTTVTSIRHRSVHPAALGPSIYLDEIQEKSVAECGVHISRNELTPLA